MSFLGNLFGKNADDRNAAQIPDQAGVMEMMRNPAMQQFAREMQSRLSKEDQKELMRLAMTRDPKKIEEFIKSKIPDVEDVAKRAGIAPQ